MLKNYSSTTQPIRVLPPADINGIGIPVGGILPLNTSYCTMIFSSPKSNTIPLYFVHYHFPIHS